MSARETILELLRSPLSRPWLDGSIAAQHVGAMVAADVLGELEKSGAVVSVGGTGWRLTK